MLRERQRRELHIRLDTRTFDALQETALRLDRPMSDLVEEYIIDRLRLQAEERIQNPGLPAVQQAVRDEMTAHIERLAALIAKTHLEAGIGERLCFVLVAQTFGAEKAHQFLDAARTKSIEALRRPIGEQRPAE